MCIQCVICVISVSPCKKPTGVEKLSKVIISVNEDMKVVGIIYLSVCFANDRGFLVALYI